MCTELIHYIIFLLPWIIFFIISRLYVDHNVGKIWYIAHFKINVAKAMVNIIVSNGDLSFLTAQSITFLQYIWS